MAALWEISPDNQNDAGQSDARGELRRELGVLRAALQHCVAEGYLLSAPPVTLPEKPPPKKR